MGMFGLGQSKEEKLERDIVKKQSDAAIEQSMIEAAKDDMVQLEMQRATADLTRWQQDLSDEELRLIYDLKNYYHDVENDKWKPRIVKWKNPETGEIISQYMAPLLNDYGVQMILTECKPFLSRNMMMSNLSEKRILTMLLRTCTTIVDNLADNFTIYETDFIDFDHIVRIIINTIMPTPYRSLGDGERKHLRTMSKRIETHSDVQNVEERRKGFMQGIFGAH